MKEGLTPTDIAREALRLLAERELSPTPENYSRLYYEIAGFPAEDSVQDAEQMLRVLAAQLPRDSQELARSAALVERAVENRNWEACRTALLALIEQRALQPAEGTAPAIDAASVRLFQLLVQCIRELTADDPRSDAEIGVIERLLAGSPDVLAAEETERSLKKLALRQGMLKRNLYQVKDTLKSALSRLLAACAEQIRRTAEPAELNRLISEVMGETKGVQTSLKLSSEELVAAPRDLEVARARIRRLERELSQVSERVIEDRLTGTLNRRGFDDAFMREAARSERHGAPLSLALLDVDGFKRLNEVYGRETGDGVLLHLARIIKDGVRRDDAVTRFGGEEFLILLPDASLDAAIDVMLRLQRSVARRPYPYHNDRNEQLLITFSAGVAQRAPGETKEALIARAEKAMHRAKQAGRNRVVASH